MSKFVYSDPAAEAAIGLPAQVVGDELDRIREEHQLLELDPAVVVDEARPEEAPLHPAFEWRDPVAAEQWREHQARNLIRSVRVVVQEPEDEPEPTVARVQQEEKPLPPLVQEFDPLAHDLSEVVGSLTTARRQLEALRDKAAKRFDRKRVISARVALAELDEAESNLEDAREALTASRKASDWREAVAH